MKLVEAAKKKRFFNFIIDLIIIGVLLEISFRIENTVEFKTPLKVFRLLLALGGYYIPMEYFLGKTVGKYITKTSVVNRDGSKISFETSIRRYLSRWIPFEFASLGLGYDAEAWHDTLTGTYVIDDDLSASYGGVDSNTLDDYLIER